LYGQQYEQYAGILPPLVVNMTLLAGSQAIQTKVRAANRPRYIFEAFLGGALCSCTVGLALMVRYGLEGGCLGLCCSTMTSVAVLLARSRTRSSEAAGPETAAIVDRRPRACAAGPNRG
jgi:O-antigen/teichoic acid export membrane protein